MQYFAPRLSLTPVCSLSLHQPQCCAGCLCTRGLSAVHVASFGFHVLLQSTVDKEVKSQQESKCFEEYSDRGEMHRTNL